MPAPHISAPFIGADELADQLKSEDPPTLLDVRYRLRGPAGRADYEEGHLPGAAFVDLDAELASPPGQGGRHPLPEPGQLQEALRRAGVRSGHPVVVYGLEDQLGPARAWWLLRWAGHDQVRVLKGGFPAWAGELSTSVESVTRGDIEVRPGGMPVLDAGSAAELARAGVLLDVRAPERFRGETEPIDPVAGHIPGAVNLPQAQLAGVDLSFLDGQEVGVYCGSGVTAARAALELESVGRPGAAVYVGSWSEWITDPSRPIATGA